MLTPTQVITPPARTPLLTPADVATYLQVWEKTLANWRSQKRGPKFLRVGRDIRYRDDDLEHWLTDVSRMDED